MPVMKSLEQLANELEVLICHHLNTIDVGDEDNLVIACTDCETILGGD